MITRRRFVWQSLAACTLARLPHLSFAAAPGDARLVVCILRGALDGLTAVVPYGDTDYRAARPDIAIAAPGAERGALRLDGLFGLHPSLTYLHERHAARELIVFHAIATAYRDRSHFDAQNLLENGTPRPFGSESGWLNRALTALPSNQYGVALAQNVPLLLRGPRQVTSWAPSSLPAVEPDLIERLTKLYERDEILADRLQQATKIDAMAQTSDADGLGRGNVQRLALMAKTAGTFLASSQGPKVAVLELTGWDTHAQEGASQGSLANRLRTLDETLSALGVSLGEAWPRTAVLVVTEFGRTVAQNGSRGTDHGTGTCAFLLGGAVAGGRVMADWPGLSARELYENRDLRPTMDLRAVCKGVLEDHLLVPQRHLEDQVFPASTAARAVRGLIKA